MRKSIDFFEIWNSLSFKSTWFTSFIRVWTDNLLLGGGQFRKVNHQVFASKIWQAENAKNANKVYRSRFLNSNLSKTTSLTCCIKKLIASSSVGEDYSTEKISIFLSSKRILIKKTSFNFDIFTYSNLSFSITIGLTSSIVVSISSFPPTEDYDISESIIFPVGTLILRKSKTCWPFWQTSSIKFIHPQQYLLHFSCKNLRCQSFSAQLIPLERRTAIITSKMLLLEQLVQRPLHAKKSKK